MTEFHFKAELAQRYGVDGAIFLHAMAFWVAKNQANGKHFHDGRTWTYNTLEALAKLFPFWSRRQLERIIAKLKEQEALLTGNYSEDKTDRTVWYALADSVLEVYELLLPISPNGEMHFTERGNRFHETVKCNKDTVTDQLYIPPIVPQGGPGEEAAKKKRPRAGRTPKTTADWKPERFEAFWTYYSANVRNEDRQAAIRAWDKLRPDDALIARIGRALERQVASPSWQAGIGKPYASTYLNNARWVEAEARPIVPDPPGEGRSYGWQ